MGRNNKASNYDKSLFQSRIYRIWYNIKTRCTNVKSPTYKIYGGRGIDFCDKWKTFEGFYNEMGESYISHCEEFGEDNTSIDRIDNNGNYSKENCKWSTRQEQCNNRRSNTFLEYNGLIKTIEEWSRFLKIKSSTLRQRYFGYKWNIEKCLTYNHIK